MEIHTDINNIRPLKNTVVTVGAFDGLHRGHQSIISRMKHLAHEIDGSAVVVSFNPHPRLVIQHYNQDIRFLSSMHEKTGLLSSFGVDHLVLINFTEEFAATSSEDFIKKIIIPALNPAWFIIGHDHHFGKNREGNIVLLKQLSVLYNFKVEQLDEFMVGDEIVNSTLIRHYLLNGDIKHAATLLGYPFAIEGTVVHGNNVGQKIGFPTANITPEDPYKLIPAYGVYAVLAEVNGKTFKGMSNIGIRPTLKDHRLNIEVHIFDFSEDIYDQSIKILFIDRIRDERKFKNLEELKTRLAVDKTEVLERLGEAGY